MKNLKKVFKIVSIATVCVVMLLLSVVSVAAESSNDIIVVFGQGSADFYKSSNNDVFSSISIDKEFQSWLGEGFKQPVFYSNYSVERGFTKFNVELDFNESFLSSLSYKNYEFNIDFLNRAFGHNNLNPIDSNCKDYDTIHFTSSLQAFLYTEDGSLLPITVSNVSSERFDTSSCLDSFTLSCSNVKLKDYKGIMLRQSYPIGYSTGAKVMMGLSIDSVGFEYNEIGTSSDFFSKLGLFSNYAFDNATSLSDFVLQNPFLVAVIGLLFVGFIVGLYFRFRK